jgi:predicted RNA-binding Zn ribbon-like protein
VDFIRYAEGSAGLLNAEIAEVDDLVRHLADRKDLAEGATDRDCMLLRKFQRELRPVFEASEAGDASGVVEGLNALMERYPITPRISDHDPASLHLHVAASSSVAELLVGESLLGLASVVCGLGPTRLGVCSAPPCTNAYVDTSPNQSRRYCSDRCSSRANVAAYRARRRKISAAGASAGAGARG